MKYFVHFNCVARTQHCLGSLRSPGNTITLKWWKEFDNQFDKNVLQYFRHFKKWGMSQVTLGAFLLPRCICNKLQLEVSASPLHRHGTEGCNSATEISRALYPALISCSPKTYIVNKIRAPSETFRKTSLYHPVHPEHHNIQSLFPWVPSPLWFP